MRDDRSNECIVALVITGLGTHVCTMDDKSVGVLDEKGEFSSKGRPSCSGGVLGPLDTDSEEVDSELSSW